MSKTFANTKTELGAVPTFFNHLKETSSEQVKENFDPEIEYSLDLFCEVLTNLIKQDYHEKTQNKASSY